MFNRPVRTAILTTAVLVCLPALALADGDIRDQWKADYPDACQTLVDAANACSLCHGAGFSLNDYAQAYKDNGQDWLAIEMMDSDGDTRTNEDEIAECTLPGDDSSVTPNDAETWGSIKILFR